MTPRQRAEDLIASMLVRWEDDEVRSACVSLATMAIAAAIREAAEEAAKWHPIATAPRDDAAFLAYGPGLWDNTFAVCTRSTYGFHVEGVSGHEFDVDIDPTHWMPLPPAPGQPSKLVGAEGVEPPT